MAIGVSYNYVLAGQNSAKQRATPRAISEATGGEASGLLDYETAGAVWVSPNAGPAATEILFEYPGDEATRALALVGGSLPLYGTRARVVRGHHLRPIYMQWSTTSSSTNATGTISRVADQRLIIQSNYVGPTTPGVQWQQTYVFHAEESPWSDGPDQKLVGAIHSSADGDDSLVTIEVKNALGSFVEVGTFTATSVYGSAVDPRFSIRLDSSQLSSPAEVRITADPGTLGDARLHVLIIVAAVEADKNYARLYGDIVDSTGTITGNGPENTRRNILATEGILGSHISIGTGSTGDFFRANLDPDPRTMTAGTLYFDWRCATAFLTTIEVFVYQDDVEVMSLGTFDSSTTSTQKESVAIAIGSLTRADGTGISIRFERTVNATEIKFSEIAVVWTPAASSNTESYDSGWFDLPQSTGTNISGGGPIDSLALSQYVAIAHAFDVGGTSTEVLATQTFIDIDVVSDPNDPSQALTLDNQKDREISFRKYFEGPGLYGVTLAKGVRIDFEDASTVSETIGGADIAIRRRRRKRATFSLNALEPSVGPGQVAAMLERVGRTEPVLLIAAPQVTELSYVFSLLGRVYRDPTLTHAYGEKSDADIVLREI